PQRRRFQSHSCANKSESPPVDGRPCAGLFVLSACLLVPLTCSAYDCRMRYTLSCATPFCLCLPPVYQGGGVALSYIHPDPLPRGEGTAGESLELFKRASA